MSLYRDIKKEARLYSGSLVMAEQRHKLAVFTGLYCGLTSLALHILLAVNETTSRGHHRLRVVATVQLFVKQHNHIITPETSHL